MVERPCLFLYRRPKKQLVDKKLFKILFKNQGHLFVQRYNKRCFTCCHNLYCPKTTKTTKKKKTPKNPSEQKQQTNKKPHDCLERGVETFDIHHLKSSS